MLRVMVAHEVLFEILHHYFFNKLELSDYSTFCLKETEFISFILSLSLSICVASGIGDKPLRPGPSHVLAFYYQSDRFIFPLI